MLPLNNSEDDIINKNVEKTEKLENENNQDISEDEEEIKLPKFRFYEYLFNNIFSEHCKMNRQIIKM